MKGAMAELWARTIKAPSRNRVTIMGTSHQRLFCMKKEKSSPATPNLRAVLRINFILLSFESTKLLSQNRAKPRSLGNSVFWKNVWERGVLQAELQILGQKINVVFVEHGLVAAADSVDLHGSHQVFPAGVKLPVLSFRPVCGLEKHHSSAIGFRLVVVRGGMNNGVEILQMTIADR